MTAKDLLDPDKIKAGLKTNRIGSDVIVFGSVSSTNDIASEYANNPDNDGLVILAEEQLSGKGRGGNRWLSDKGKSVLCSVVLTDESISSELLSLTVAVAVADTIGEPAKIKWPNDILLDGKKVGGILVESKQTKAGAAFIIGIGINCHQKKFADDLSSTAISLDMKRKGLRDRTTIIKRLFGSLEDWLIEARENPAAVIQAWQELSTQLNHRIAVIFNGKEFTGTCVGIDPEKGLILELDHGGRQFFTSQQTSIKK